MTATSTTSTTSPAAPAAPSRLEGDAERTYRVLFENAGTPMALVDTAGRFLRTNPLLRALLGVPGEKLDGRSFLNVVHPADREAILGIVRRGARRGQDLFQLEKRFLRADGTHFWGLVTVSVSRDDAGAPEFFLPQVLDITDRKRREILQEGRNEVLEVVAGGAPLPETLHTLATVAERAMPGVRVAIFLADPERGRLRHVTSPSMPDWFREATDGFEISETGSCSGRACARGERVITPNLQDHPAWADHRAQLVESGIRACWSEPILASDREALGTITLLLRESGPPRAIDLEFIAATTYLARLAIERSRTVDALTASAEQYRRIFESTTDGLILFAPDATIVDVNPAACAMHGYTREQFRALSPPDFVHPDSMSLFDEFRASLASGEEYRCEAKDIRADGTAFDLDVRGVPFRFGGRPHLLGILRDITERKRDQEERAAHARELEIRNRDLEDFASIASHDLQEPLRKIRAFGDMLGTEAGDVLGDRGRIYLKRILDSADWGRTLVRDIRRYSRTAAAPEMSDSVDLNDVVTGALSDLEIRMREESAVVSVERLPVVTGDSVQLRLLVVNLIGNALKFRRENETPRIRIFAKELPEGGHRLCFEDNGIGFEPEYADRIFGVFERLHGREDYEGTGMGLAIVRRVVERHGGAVRAIGDPGRGARFEVDLPGR